MLGLGAFLFRVTTSHLLLQSAVMAAIALAATLAWRSARTLPDGWRRGVTAAIGAFGGLLLGALTAPLDMVGGPVALLVFALVMAGTTWRALRAARRAEQA